MVDWKLEVKGIQIQNYETGRRACFPLSEGPHCDLLDSGPQNLTRATKKGASCQSVAGSTIFSSLDVTKGFFQQPILLKDRWKITFLSPHRGHEQLTVTFMGLASSLDSFQA